jgi:uncharacterized metal-binding protein
MEMSKENQGVCEGGPKLVFACSGAADLGHISDLAARKMTADGSGQMFCLVGVGGDVKPIVEKTKAASKIVAIDGCNLDCTKKLLEKAGFFRFEHLRVSDLGMEKGKTAVDDMNVEIVAKTAAVLLG